MPPHWDITRHSRSPPSFSPARVCALASSLAGRPLLQSSVAGWLAGQLVSTRLLMHLRCRPLSCSIYFDHRLRWWCRLVVTFKVWMSLFFWVQLFLAVHREEGGPRVRFTLRYIVITNRWQW